MDLCFILTDACNAATAFLRPFEELEEQKLDDVDDDIKKGWDAGELCNTNERSPSALERLKSVCGTLSLPVPTTLVDAQQRIEDTIRTFADYSRLEVCVKPNMRTLQLIKNLISIKWLLMRRRCPSSSRK